MREGKWEINWEKERGKGPHIGRWVWRRRNRRVGLTATRSAGGSKGGDDDGDGDGDEIGL